MISFLQRLADAQRGTRDKLTVDMVLACWDALRLATAAALRLALEKRVNPFDDPLDHAAARSNSCRVRQPRS